MGNTLAIASADMRAPEGGPGPQTLGVGLGRCRCTTCANASFDAIACRVARTRDHNVKGLALCRARRANVWTCLVRVGVRLADAYGSWCAAFMCIPYLLFGIVAQLATRGGIVHLWRGLAFCRLLTVQS